jgi:hypothetical protein
MLSALCKPRPSVFEKDRRATVLNLDNFLADRIPGESFFRENYFTSGMSTLVERCFRQLGGSTAGSSVFLLSQAMGGGKTHSMVALGLMARDPGLRRKVLGAQDPGPSLGKVKVIGFNGRNVEPAFGIWGSLAEQLGRKSQFGNYYQPLSAPGPQAWKELLDDQPVIVLLDELPPYMEHARSVQIGNSDLAVVTAAALANLLVAASELDSVVVVISDLAGASWQSGGDMIQQSLANLKNETQRIAVPITPVNPQGDDLYQILRCRLFETLPGRSNIEGVADRYRKAHGEAVKMGLTSTQSDGLYQQILDSYPFHPAWRDLIGRFKENDGFQQTRGVIRLMQMVVSNLWSTGRADALELLHPYDLDLNDPEIGSEVRTINQHLSEAVAHDIAHSGQAEAEEIDARNKNTDASDATRLVLLASLSTTAGAVHGIREYELYDFLQRPGRDLSAFKASVLDILDTRAWYLHRSQDGRLFFKNQQNLAAKLRSTAQSLNNETVLKELRKFLADRFAPLVRDAYQSVAVLPGLDEVQLEQDKVVLVLAEPSGGHGGLPLSQDWQGWWAHQAFKNRILFLTGSRMVIQNVNDSARQVRALQSIEEELRAEATPTNDPQWRALDALKDRLLNQLSSALTQAFDTLVFPSIGDSLRAQAITLEFRGNNWHGEDIVRRTLEAAQKFTADVSTDGFRLKAETRLFTSKSTLWTEVRRKAATTTTWQFHSARALDDLKNESVRKGLWREQGQYVEKGPFPKAETSVSIKELSRSEDGTSWLRVEPLHGDVVYFETGTNAPTTASSKVADFQRFEAKHLHYRFLCVDTSGDHPTGAVVPWSARIEVKYNLNAADGRLELRATPKGQIRYSTDGTAPENGASYEGPFVLPASCRVVLAVAEAEGIKSERLTINVPRRGPGGGGGGGGGGGIEFQLDPTKPCKWKRQHKLDDTAAVWAWVEQLEKTAGRAQTVALTAESAVGDQTVEFSGAGEGGYSGAQVRELCDRSQVMAGGQSSLRLKVQRVDFERGQSLLDWLQATGQKLNPAEVEQER